MTKLKTPETAKTSQFQGFFDMSHAGLEPKWIGLINGVKSTFLERRDKIRDKILVTFFR